VRLLAPDPHARAFCNLYRSNLLSSDGSSMVASFPSHGLLSPTEHLHGPGYDEWSLFDSKLCSSYVETEEFVRSRRGDRDVVGAARGGRGMPR
jgi:hypothetical protein